MVKLVIETIHSMETAIEFFKKLKNNIVTKKMTTFFILIINPIEKQPRRFQRIFSILY